MVVLQLLPFLVGILMRRWTEHVALRWNEFASTVAGVLFLFVLAAAPLGSWQTLVDLLGDLVLLTGAVVAVVMVAIGYFVSTGDTQTRRATGSIQPMTNSGPGFAAVAIAFDNDPAILGAVTGILLIQLVGGTIIASYFGKDAERQPEPASA